jgi:preprotein translocase subunit SecG
MKGTDNMGVWSIVLGSVLIVAAIAIIFVIILQQGNQQGLGVVTGAADSYFSKNKARSIDAFLSRWTKVFAAVFVLIVVALNVLAYFLGSTF